MSSKGTGAPLSRDFNHDLQAQLINVKGFCSEIERSASELESFSNHCMSELDAEMSGRLNKLLTEDLLPCIRFLILSTSQLDGVVDKYRTSAQDSE